MMLISRLRALLKPDSSVRCKKHFGSKSTLGREQSTSEGLQPTRSGPYDRFRVERPRASHAMNSGRTPPRGHALFGTIPRFFIRFAGGAKDIADHNSIYNLAVFFDQACSCVQI